ncbi:peptide chain release factor N(5)-glutamine methyltransferase [Spongiimicrobium salis]|uniref:peptide chain release factor N(5)-glutamine methyltransferase n=1 Tax=Spongiimicrobium salis TaxID=1667022 RepID=UPI00374D8D89
MLLKEIKNIFHTELKTLYTKEEITNFFYILLDHYLGLESFILALEPQKIISKTEEQPLFEALTLLKQERPIQYITNTSFFFDLRFYVDDNVLIPRPETEELVEWIISSVSGGDGTPIKILDIGTGSGCIALTLAKHLPQAKVYALDVSEAALNVARKNAELLKLDIHLVQGDILSMDRLPEQFDIIVSNPPYVRELEKKEIRNNVKDHEPAKALFVPDNTPLLFYKKIGELAAQFLTRRGSLYFEINQYLGKETGELLKHQNFLEIEGRKDHFGNDRMLKAKKR